MLAQSRVCLTVGEHDEAQLDQLFRSFQSLHRVGQKVARVGMNLELEPIGAEGLAGHLGGKDGFFCVAYSRSVGKELDVGLHHVRKHIVLLAFAHLDSFHRNCHHLRS